MTCPYRPIPGQDIDIDGNVWPGSDYAKHLESPEHAAEPCPQCHRVGDHKLGCSRRDGRGLRLNAAGPSDVDLAFERFADVGLRSMERGSTFWHRQREAFRAGWEARGG